MNRLRLGAFCLTAIASVGALLWMRELASWRPKLLATLPLGVRTGALSPDGQLLVLVDPNDLNATRFRALDFKSGTTFNWSAPLGWNGNSFVCFLSPAVVAISATTETKPVLQLRRAGDGASLGTFPLHSDLFFNPCGVRLVDDGTTLVVANGGYCERWDVSSAKQKSVVALEGAASDSTMSGWKASHSNFAVTMDGSQIIGRQHLETKIWDALTGLRCGGWKRHEPRASAQVWFSPDARFLVYRPVFTGQTQNDWSVIAAKTGQTLWQYTATASPLFSADGRFLFAQSPTGCEVRDAATGVEQPGRAALVFGGNLLGGSRDWAITEGGRAQIRRWRLR